MVWSGVDPLLTQLYDCGIFLLFTRTAQIVIAATALIGFVVFVMNLRSVGGRDTRYCADSQTAVFVAFVCRRRGAA